MSPENATCERAFSVMKYIKNDQHSCLTQLYLDNALCIALEDRKPSVFPFEQLLHWRYFQSFNKSIVLFMKPDWWGRGAVGTIVSV